MFVKFLVGGLMIFMVYNLYKAMRIMMNPDYSSENMSKFIGRRVLTSVCIVVVVLIAVATGLIEPNPRPY